MLTFKRSDTTIARVRELLKSWIDAGCSRVGHITLSATGRSVAWQVGCFFAVRVYVLEPSLKDSMDLQSSAEWLNSAEAVNWNWSQCLN